MSEETPVVAEVPTPPNRGVTFSPFQSPQLTDICKQKAVPLNVPLGDATGGREAVRESVTTLAKKLSLNATEVKTLTRFMEGALNGQWSGERYQEIVSRIENPASALEIDGRKLRVSHPKVAAVGEDNRITGLAAITLINSTNGTGKSTTVPLYHSGIRATLGLFNEDSLLDLQIQLAERRVEVGRQTRGVIYSTDDSYLLTTIADFIIANIIDSTVKTTDSNRVEVMRRVIKTPDIASLIVAGLADIYPGGYPYVAVCMDAECTYKTITESGDGDVDYPMLDFKRMLFVDPDRVSDATARFMAKPMRTHTEKEVLDFQSKHLATEEETGPLNDTGNAIYRLVLETPSYEDYRALSIAWLDNVVETVTKSLTLADPTTEAGEQNRRSTYIRNRLNLYSPLRSGCWVKSIKISMVGEDEPLVIEGVDDVYESLKALCKTKAIKKSLLDSIEDYKIRNIYAYTGIGKHKCPKCQKDQQVENPRHQEIIPINVVSYFFDIMGWKILESYI